MGIFIDFSKSLSNSTISPLFSLGIKTVLIPEENQKDLSEIDKDIEKKTSVKKITNHKYFCSLIVGKNQEILYEKYANDFSRSQPQTIMSILSLIHI